jgi:hypothetical protein
MSPLLSNVFAQFLEWEKTLFKAYEQNHDHFDENNLRAIMRTLCISDSKIDFLIMISLQLVKVPSSSLSLASLTLTPPSSSLTSSLITPITPITSITPITPITSSEADVVDDDDILTQRSSHESVQSEHQLELEDHHALRDNDATSEERNPSGDEEESGAEEDDAISTTRTLRTTRRGQKRKRSPPNGNDQVLSQNSTFSESEESFILSQHNRNEIQTYHIYIIWSYNRFYCKIGITSSNVLNLLKRYKTYIANFIYWFIPIIIRCRWELAKKYEDLVHASLSKYLIHCHDF